MKRAAIVREIAEREREASEAAAKAAREAQILNEKREAFANNFNNIAQVQQLLVRYTPPGAYIASDKEASEILRAVFDANKTELGSLYCNPKFAKARDAYRHIVYDIPSVKYNDILGDVDKIATDYKPAYERYQINNANKQFYNDYYAASNLPHLVKQDANGSLPTNYDRANPYNLSTNFDRFIEMLQNSPWIKK